MLEVTTPDSARHHLLFTGCVTAQLSESTVHVLGEAHRPDPPARTGTKVTVCMSGLQQEVLVRNTELMSHHQLEEFGKGIKETPHVRPPPRILLPGLHHG